MFERYIKTSNTLPLSSLPSVKYSDRRFLPEAAAIYFATNEEDVIYIGSTKNLKKRWVNHSLKHTYDFVPDCAIRWYLLPTVDIENRHRLEMAFKVKHNPKIKGQAGKGACWAALDPSANHHEKIVGGNECVLCGHTWNSKGKKQPKCCPCCKSYQWRKP